MLAFVGPLTVIASSYVCLNWGLRLRRRSHGVRDGGRMSSCSLAPSSPLSHSFVKMMAAIISAFALCWAPYHALCLLEMASHEWPYGSKLVEAGLPLATTAAFLNAILNPVLYAFSCPHFCVRIRQSLGAVLEGLLEEGELGNGCSHRRTRLRRDTPASIPQHSVFLSQSSSSFSYQVQYRAAECQEGEAL
ncbi:hypothetical protein Z043_125398 [Scleropages formosus]|uniref:G-protein coupled receptors family 1 profile domain-containing protein n=1 Tax=Scleropages formosus TaxID=113540 RepID=A0A0P7W7N4_SCLFO|nr:hypothetical protein Z043_125398 [Scleropages formosus]